MVENGNIRDKDLDFSRTQLDEAIRELSPQVIEAASGSDPENHRALLARYDLLLERRDDMSIKLAAEVEDRLRSSWLGFN